MSDFLGDSLGSTLSGESGKKGFSLGRIEFNSPVIMGFAFVSLVALLLGYLTNNYTTTKFFCVYKCSWSDPLAYIRLFGHVLGHADFSHFINNMMLFMLIGPLVEEKYGSKDLLVMILITAFITGIVNMFFFRGGLLGASGIVFMLIVLSAASVMKGDRIPITLIIVVVMYIGQQVYNGVFTRDNISQLTHIIGGICGGVFGVFNAKTQKE